MGVLTFQRTSTTVNVQKNSFSKNNFLTWQSHYTQRSVAAPMLYAPRVASSLTSKCVKLIIVALIIIYCLQFKCIIDIIISKNQNKNKKKKKRKQKQIHLFFCCTIFPNKTKPNKKKQKTQNKKKKIKK